MEAACPLKHYYLNTSLHGVLTQKTMTGIFLAMKVSSAVHITNFDFTFNRKRGKELAKLEIVSHVFFLHYT
jgi:hypothetical protein